MAVIGNSSSGIIEAPCFHVPTVNIGDRQKGRLMPDSVICCEPKKDEIILAIKKAISENFCQEVKGMSNPFGDGETSKQIVSVLKEEFEKNGNINLMKKFYDIM